MTMTMTATVTQDCPCCREPMRMIGILGTTSTVRHFCSDCGIWVDAISEVVR